MRENNNNSSKQRGRPLGNERHFAESSMSLVANDRLSIYLINMHPVIMKLALVACALILYLNTNAQLYSGARCIVDDRKTLSVTIISVRSAEVIGRLHRCSDSS